MLSRSAAGSESGSAAGSSYGKERKKKRISEAERQKQQGQRGMYGLALGDGRALGDQDAVLAQSQVEQILH